MCSVSTYNEVSVNVGSMYVWMEIH